MTAAAAHEPGRHPFAHASPARIRAALTTKDAEAFDEQWRSLMRQATEILDLTDVNEALDAWRDVAWMTSTYGAATYRATIDAAEERARTGERAPGAVPWSQLKAELGLDD